VSEPSTGAEVEHIAQQIELYLARHGNAADTALGIARWWLALPDADAVLPLVESALERLVQRGVATSRVLPDGNRVYAAAAGKPPG
jgi:hypothetical protein